ncbi:MAG: peptide deformylase [Candidatus Riflebacteria bacterium]|nr:peptide deformylase [Candidatus Riflebacteria bacterium]
MKYRVLHYGEKPLRTPSKPINEINEELRALVEDMFETMYESNGVGLAAPQIGENIRLVVMDPGEDPIAMINPEIIKKSGKVVDMEGCLSFPGLAEEVARYQAVTVRFTDPDDGEEYEIEAEDLLARIIQHELDHLDGIVFIDRISEARRFVIKGDLELIKQGYDLSADDEDEEEEEGCSDCSSCSHCTHCG